MEIGPGDRSHRTGKSPAEGFHPTNPCPEQGIQTPPPLLAGPSSVPGAADSQRDRDPAGQISEDTDTRVDMSSSSLSLCYLNPRPTPSKHPICLPHLLPLPCGAPGSRGGVRNSNLPLGPWAGIVSSWPVPPPRRPSLSPKTALGFSTLPSSEPKSS